MEKWIRVHFSREIGHNSYKRIKNFDFSAGYEYWEKTKGYWKDVRDFGLSFRRIIQTTQ